MLGKSARFIHLGLQATEKYLGPTIIKKSFINVLKFRVWQSRKLLCHSMLYVRLCREDPRKYRPRDVLTKVPQEKQHKSPRHACCPWWIPNAVKELSLVWFDPGKCRFPGMVFLDTAMQALWDLRWEDSDGKGRPLNGRFSTTRRANNKLRFGCPEQQQQYSICCISAI